MGGVVVEMTMSLDGFVAASNPTLEEPLGQDGVRLRLDLRALQLA